MLKQYIGKYGSKCLLCISALAMLGGCAKAADDKPTPSVSPTESMLCAPAETQPQSRQADEDAQEQSGAYTFTDALENEVAVDNPKRVVALMGGFAETWLLAGGELVGVTDDATEERGLELGEDVAVVGKYNSPNAEEIIALNPDLVLLSSETKEHVALQDTLKNANITAAYFNVTHFEDYLDMLKVCTDITGKKELYEQNGESIKEKIENQIVAVPEGEAPEVLLLITFSGGVRVQNSSTMTGKMLAELGCENMADKNPSILKEFSIEAILADDPDYIFVVPMGNDDQLAMQHLEESIEANPAWNGLTAVKNDRYILLPKEKFLYKPNSRWNESYEHLANILYGQQ